MPRVHLLLLPFALGLAGAAQANGLFDAVAQARQACGATSALRPSAALDETAARLAQGVALKDALKASGYRALRSYQWSMGGYPSSQAVGQALRKAQCRTLADPEVADVGVLQRGTSYWIVAAVPFDPPAQAQAPEVAARVLALVNEARSAPRQCGNRSFGPAAPLVLNPQLMEAAEAHAADMARRNYMEHEGRDGSTPADRATRAGYPWRSVGENIASGQPTPDAVVQGWLKSPPHCANIMQPRYTEMGLAFAVEPASDNGIYWAQSFGRR